MANFNKIILLGNCTRDPEIRFSITGMPIASWGMAVNRRYKDQEETTFVDVTAFQRTAEIAGEYLKKGSPVLIEGRLKQESWETQDGQKRSKLVVIVEALQLMPRGQQGDGGVQGTKIAPQTPLDDDIPF
jgi:single-strand DNA-binding protein